MGTRVISVVSCRRSLGLGILDALVRREFGDVVDEPVRQCFLGVEELVAFAVRRDRLDLLPGVPGEE